MSSQPSTTTISPGGGPKPKQPVSKPHLHPPITILSNPVAQTYAYIHPLLVLSLYSFRFDALIQDPVSTLSHLLPIIGILQTIYIIICLPAAGSTIGGGTGIASGKSRSSGKGAYKRKAGGDGDIAIGSKIVPALLSLALPLLLGTPFLAVVLILFGAPFTTQVFHTFLCAAHMSVLCGTSLVYVHGTNGDVWREVWGISHAVDTVWGATVGTALGAWLGAVPIPLDWDRPWQAYPITILTGAYIGYTLGCWMGRTPLLYGRRIQFTSEEEEDGGEENATKK